MDSDNADRERIVKQIAKTSDSIRKKYRALKTGKMDEDIALERHFKPVIEPLKQIAENIEHVEKPDESETLNTSYDASVMDFTPVKSKLKQLEEPTRKRLNSSHGTHRMASTPIKRPKTKFLDDIAQSREISFESAHAPSVEEIFEITDEPLATSIHQQMQTSEGREKLRRHYGPLGRKYMGAVLSGKKTVNIDNVYGVSCNDTGTMLGDKRVDLDKNDDIIIDGKRYAGTPGLYELIFMNLPNEEICTSEDTENYKKILLATNAHRYGHSAQNRVVGSKGHKYKNIIAPLLKNRAGKGISDVVKLNNNKIDYVHWDDPNELVDRLRLLEASRHAGHNAHDNEISSIIEELREVGLIIN